MPRSEWAIERFIYLHDISQGDSVKRYCACTALATECQEDSSFLVAGQKIDDPAHRTAANELQEMASSRQDCR
jgi:hypothetical protein